MYSIFYDLSRHYSTYRPCERVHNLLYFSPSNNLIVRFIMTKYLVQFNACEKLFYLIENVIKLLEKNKTIFY
jgi:hypothetical protein